LFVGILNDYPIATGIYLIILGILLLLYRLGKKDSFKMKDYNIFSWKVLVNTWAVIIIILMMGLFLLTRNISF
jgi:hypothetical protein